MVAKSNLIVSFETWSILQRYKCPNPVSRDYDSIVILNPAPFDIHTLETMLVPKATYDSMCFFLNITTFYLIVIMSISWLLFYLLNLFSLALAWGITDLVSNAPGCRKKKYIMVKTNQTFSGPELLSTILTMPTLFLFCKYYLFY